MAVRRGWRRPLPPLPALAVPSTTPRSPLEGRISPSLRRADSLSPLLTAAAAAGTFRSSTPTGSDPVNVAASGIQSSRRHCARQPRPTTSSPLLGERPRCTLHPRKTWFASSKILSPCLISLLEYHERKNFPFSVRYVPSSLKNWVFSGVSLYSPASSGNSHSGWPAFAAAALKSASRSEHAQRFNCLWSSHV